MRDTGPRSLVGLSGTAVAPDLLDHAAPAVTSAQAAELAAEIFGVCGDVQWLSAEKDANFRITPAKGPPVLLKITNAAEDRGVTEMQTAALMHLGRVDPTLPVPHIRPTLTGRAAHILSIPGGQSHMVRLLTYLEGTTLGQALSATGLHQDIGALLARLTIGLRGFDHPAAGHMLQWDIKRAHHLRPMLEAVEDGRLRGRLTRLIDRFDAEIAPRLCGLRAQVVHNDFNPHNLLVDAPRATRLTGIIDFGDMVHTPLVCDLAVACSYQIGDGPRPIEAIGRLLAGYAAILPLERAELDLLPDLMRMRHAATLTIGAWRARRYPANAAYLRRNGAASLRGLTVLDRIGTAAVLDILKRALPPERMP